MSDPHTERLAIIGDRTAVASTRDRLATIMVIALALAGPIVPVAQAQDRQPSGAAGNEAAQGAPRSPAAGDGRGPVGAAERRPFIVPPPPPRPTAARPSGRQTVTLPVPSAPGVVTGAPPRTGAGAVPEGPRISVPTIDLPALAIPRVQSNGGAPAVPSIVPPPPPRTPTAPPQVAALTDTREVRLLFAPSSADVPREANPILDALAARLAQSPDARVQLRAFAGASVDGPRAARRLSLDRALAIRAYLAERGVRSTRVDLRALGATAADGPSDRLDILIVD